MSRASFPPESTTRGSGGSSLGLEHLTIVGDYRQDGAFKDLLDALHLLAAALHVLRAHLLGNGEALLRSHGRETLRLEHVDTRLLVAQVRLEADEDQWGVRAEMQNFGVPLKGRKS